jgi:TRAP transporter TAXI family solute receptor
MSSTEKAVRMLPAIPVFLLVLLCASCAEPRAPQTVVKVGSGAAAGVYSDLARAFVRTVNENQAGTELQLETSSSTGSVANINDVLAGKVQFAIAQADDQFRAVNGLGQWAENGPQEDLRSVAGIYSEVVTLVAGGDSDINTIADLKGKRVDIGLVGSGTRINAIDALEAAGLDWEKDIQLSEMNVDDRLTAFMHGELDAFFFTVGHPSIEIKFATFSLRGARLISLAGIDSLLTEKAYYSPQAIPMGRYPMAANKASTLSVGVRATLITSASVPDEVVYAVTKTAYENAEKLQLDFPEFAELRDGDILAGLTAPLHPGALKFFQEIGVVAP